MKAIYHGHSFIELQTAEGSILVDPFVTANPKCDISLEDLLLRNILAICITHGHADHVGDVLLIKEHFPDIPVYTVTGVAKYLEKQGCRHCVGGSLGGTLHHDLFTVKLVVAHHDSTILDTGISTNPSGMIITVGGKNIYHMGDTCLTKDFELIGDYGPKIDCLFVPIGDYYTMGIDDAVIATKMIHPTTVVPIHYNTRSIISVDPIEFARKVMLEQCAVPKVLHAGQYILL